MARGMKKEKELTVEERLEQALVPVEEQPYSVPENWCWTKLGNITEIIGGGTPSSSVKEYYEGGTITWITPADLSGYKNIFISSGEKKITELGLKKSSAKLLPPNTVCLSSRAPIGYVAIAQNELCTNQGFKNFLPSICYAPQYLYWYLKGNKELLQGYASGTTFLELSGNKAAIIPIPLPPLAEQQRIIDRIESLFSKLDEAKEKAQAVVDGFETRKAAILHKAFTGELTAKWRQEKGIGIDTWKVKPLKDICKYMRAGGDKPQDFSDNKDKEHQIPVVANGINNDGIIGFTGISKEEGHSVTLSGRGTIGFSIYRDYPYYPVVRLIVLAPQYYIRGLYLKYYFDAFPEEGTGSSIPQLTVPMVKEKQVLFPIIDEQDAIINIIDFLIKKEQQAKEAAEAVLDQIETMKKAILARAFRGELGTNDPAEESAVELLKQV